MSRQDFQLVRPDPSFRKIALEGSENAWGSKREMHKEEDDNYISSSRELKNIITLIKVPIRRK